MLGRNGTDRPQPRARSRSVHFALPTSVPGRLLEARACGCLATSVRAVIPPSALLPVSVDFFEGTFVRGLFFTRPFLSHSFSFLRPAAGPTAAKRFSSFELLPTVAVLHLTTGLSALV